MNTMHLLQNVTAPFTSLEYYKDSIHKSFTSSALRVFLTIFLLSFVSGFVFLQQSYPVIINSIQNTITDISNHYPNDLILDWDGSKLIANKNTIEVPWRDDLSSEIQEFPNMFLYYSNSTQSPEDLDIQVSESMFFVNQTALYHSNDENPTTWTQQPLQNILTPDLSLTIDKNMVLQTSSTAQEFMRSNSTKISALFFSAYILIFILSKLSFLIIETMLVVLLFKLYALKLQTKQAIILSLHVMIPTVVVNTIAELLYSNISIPLQTITFWILIIFVSSQFKNQTKETA